MTTCFHKSNSSFVPFIPVTVAEGTLNFKWQGLASEPRLGLCRCRCRGEGRITLSTGTHQVLSVVAETGRHVNEKASAPKRQGVMGDSRT